MRDALIVVVAVVFLTVPANLVVKVVLGLAGHPGTVESNRAGRWIGAIERLLILVLMLAGQTGTAGLVVAAKTILRFPEINARPAKIDPEYVLVGSLTSWLIAFATGALVMALT